MKSSRCMYSKMMFRNVDNPRLGLCWTVFPFKLIIDLSTSDQVSQQNHYVDEKKKIDQKNFQLFEMLVSLYTLDFIHIHCLRIEKIANCMNSVLWLCSQIWFKIWHVYHKPSLQLPLYKWPCKYMIPLGIKGWVVSCHTSWNKDIYTTYLL